nr:hypothetical transcript [Hymenolepis microstoma]
MALQLPRIPTPSEMQGLYKVFKEFYLRNISDYQSQCTKANTIVSLTPLCTMSSAIQNLMLYRTHSTETSPYSNFQMWPPIGISNGNTNEQQISDDIGLDTSWMASIIASGSSNRVSTEATQLTSDGMKVESYSCRYCQKCYDKQSSCRVSEYCSSH